MIIIKKIKMTVSQRNKKIFMRYVLQSKFFITFNLQVFNNMFRLSCTLHNLEFIVVKFFLYKIT